MREIKFRGYYGENGPGLVSGMQILSAYNLGPALEDDSFDGAVMQYTGLKDKNGKEIYEGDIVDQLHLPEYGRKENPRYKGKVTFDATAGWRVGAWGIWPNDCEVIGNIYENPELLEPSPEREDKDND